jgi:hypothetical protein
MEHFNKLFQLDVNEHVEKKNNLSYLTWAWAWAEVKKIYPDASYTIKTFENGLPYVYDPNTGYMVFTTVTIEGLTHEMWLPVMDGANKAMKAEAYTYTTKYGEKDVEPASMFDINKTIMRCLVKNLAMFGLGLYIYAGEDLPEDLTPPQPISESEAVTLENMLKKRFDDETIAKTLKSSYGVNSVKELTAKQYTEIMNQMRGK